MEIYTFGKMIKDLQNGREIEFRFQNNSYGIINKENYWYLCCSEQKKSIKLCEFDDTNELTRKLSDKNIFELDLKAIFDLSQYETGSLFIL